MNVDKLIEILKNGNVIIPEIVFQNYNKLNITNDEFIILIYLMNEKNKIIYDPIEIANYLNLDKIKVMELLSTLEEKKIINIIIEKNSNSKAEEYISLDLFYSKLASIIIDHHVDQVKEVKTTIYDTFEKEFGRTLSPMEYEIITGWISANFSEELIIEALKEATYNGVSNLRYIDKILYEWHKKGLKTKEDVNKQKNNYRDNKKDKVEVFDYNWLEDE